MIVLHIVHGALSHVLLYFFCNAVGNIGLLQQGVTHMPVLSACTLWPDNTAADTAVLSVRCADGVLSCSHPHFSPSCGVQPQVFPPAGGIGDRGILGKLCKCTFARCLRQRRPRRRWLFPADGGALFERKVDSNTGGHGPHLFQKKEMSGSSARHPVSQGPSAQGVNVTPKIEEAGCLDDTLPVIITVQNHGRALNAPVSSIFALRNQEFALF